MDKNVSTRDEVVETPVVVRPEVKSNLVIAKLKLQKSKKKKRRKKDKSSQRKEKKATQTLAIVLGTFMWKSINSTYVVKKKHRHT